MISGLVSVKAQTLDPSFTVSDVWAVGSVKDVVVQPDGKRLIVGIFSRAEGQVASNLVRYNADGTLDQAFLLNVRNYAWAPERLIVLRTGKLLVQVSGTVELVPGVSRRYLVRLNADGTLDTSFNSGSGPNATSPTPSPGRNGVLLEQPDGRVLVGGIFTAFNGQPANRLVRLLESGVTDTSFSPPALNPSGYVSHLVLQPDGRIVVGGFFTVLGGSRRQVIRLLPNGMLDTGFQYVPTSGFIHAVVQQADGKLLISHGYHVARYFASGAYDGSFLNSTLNLGGLVSLLLPQAGGSVYVGVQSNDGSGQPVIGLSRLSSTGAIDASFTLPAALANRSWTVESLALQQADGKLLVASANIIYPSGNLLQARRLMVLEPNGALSNVFNLKILTPGFVRSLALQPTGEVLLGGTFTQIGELAVGNVARLYADGQVDTAFVRRSALDGAVYRVMRQSGGGIVVSGGFGRVGQTNTRSTIRLTTTGQLDQSFAYLPWDNITFTAEPTLNDQTIVHGYLNGNRNLATLYRLRADGTLDNTFAVATTAGLNEVEQFKVLSDGRIMTKMVDPVGNAKLMRLLISGAMDASFSPIEVGTSGDEDIILLGADAQDRAVAATFNNITNQYRIARYALAGNEADPGFSGSLAPDDDVYTFVPQSNNRMLLIGSFRTGSSSTAVRRILSDGQEDASFNGSVLSGIGYTGIVQPDGKLLIAGIELGGSAEVVRLTAPSVLQANSRKPDGFRYAWPVPAHHELHLNLDAAARPKSVQLFDSMGRMVCKQIVNQMAFTLDIRHLRAGVYLLRVENRAESVTQRVVIE